LGTVAVGLFFYHRALLNDWSAGSSSDGTPADGTFGTKQHLRDHSARRRTALSPSPARTSNPAPHTLPSPCCLPAPSAARLSRCSSRQNAPKHAHSWSLLVSCRRLAPSTPTYPAALRARWRRRSPSGARR